MQALSQLSYSPTDVVGEGTGRLPRLSTCQKVSDPGRLYYRYYRLGLPSYSSTVCWALQRYPSHQPVVPLTILDNALSAPRVLYARMAK